MDLEQIYRQSWPVDCLIWSMHKSTCLRSRISILSQFVNTVQLRIQCWTEKYWFRREKCAKNSRCCNGKENIPHFHTIQSIKPINQPLKTNIANQSINQPITTEDCFFEMDQRFFSLRCVIQIIPDHNVSKSPSHYSYLPRDPKPPTPPTSNPDRAATADWHPRRRPCRWTGGLGGALIGRNEGCCRSDPPPCCPAWTWPLCWPHHLAVLALWK